MAHHFSHPLQSPKHSVCSQGLLACSEPSCFPHCAATTAQKAQFRLSAHTSNKLQVTLDYAEISGKLKLSRECVEGTRKAADTADALLKDEEQLENTKSLKGNAKEKEVDGANLI